MNRENTNKIRFVLEDVVPPVLRDSKLFRAGVRALWGHHVDEFASFRERAPFLSDQEYEELYSEYPRIHDHTDNSQVCIDRIIKDVAGTSVCDVGCGTGMLLRLIRAQRPDVTHFGGIDVQLEETTDPDEMDIRQGRIEKLPFDDNSFDTVVCTHVLEHILDIQAAIRELRRIARKKILIVVPREREYRYTFNPHFHFFPYTYSFVRIMMPERDSYTVEDLQRDIYYRENIS